VKTVYLAVNGTLMRGLELNENLTSIGAAFVREDQTDTHYKLWSIDDKYPAMLRTLGNGNHVAVEVWEVPAEELVTLLQNEPPGLSVGKVILEDGSVMLGIIAEPFLCENRHEITQHGGWRAYVESRSAN